MMRSILAWSILAVGSMAMQTDSGPPSARDVEQRWQAMTEEEREEFRANYERWKSLQSDDRELLKSRHDRLERWRQATLDRLAASERQRIDKLPGHERRREVRRLTRDQIHGILEALPRDLKARIEPQLRRLPADQRSDFITERVREELGTRFPILIEQLVQQGHLKVDEGRQMRQRFGKSNPQERFHMLHRLLNRYSEQFAAITDVLDQVPTDRDPMRTMDSVRTARGLDLSVDLLVRYLRSYGVPERELRRLHAADFPHNTMHRLCNKHGVVPPHALQRYLRAEGVSKEAIHRLFSGQPNSFRDRLQRMLAHYDLKGMDWEDYSRRLRRSDRASDRAPDRPSDRAPETDRRRGPPRDGGVRERARDGDPKRGRNPPQRDGNPRRPSERGDGRPIVS